MFIALKQTGLRKATVVTITKKTAHMPGSHGGDQLSKEYAPHLYIGDNFVGSNTKEIKIGKWIYKAGRTGTGENQQVVAERWPFGIHPSEIPEKTQSVPYGKIPKKVITAF